RAAHRAGVRAAGPRREVSDDRAAWLRPPPRRPRRTATAFRGCCVCDTSAPMNNTAVARGATSEYSKYSNWLETCGGELAPSTGVDGSIDVDMAILGAGHTGA